MSDPITTVENDVKKVLSNKQIVNRALLTAWQTGLSYMLLNPNLSRATLAGLCGAIVSAVYHLLVNAGVL